MQARFQAAGTPGIGLICANSPQAKGKVKLVNQTFQDRLIKGTRSQRINSYRDANKYLPVFLDSYEHKFAVLPRPTGDAHTPIDPEINLDFLFSNHDARIIWKVLLIHYHSTTCKILTKRPSQNLIGREVLTVEDEYGRFSAFMNHNS